jgi:hypothetical protein
MRHSTDSLNRRPTNCTLSGRPSAEKPQPVKSDRTSRRVNSGRDEAVARVQALALRVIAERLEHREAPAEFLNVTFQAA